MLTFNGVKFGKADYCYLVKPLNFDLTLLSFALSEFSVVHFRWTVSVSGAGLTSGDINRMHASEADKKQVKNKIDTVNIVLMFAVPCSMLSC